MKPTSGFSPRSGVCHCCNYYKSKYDNMSYYILEKRKMTLPTLIYMKHFRRIGSMKSNTYALNLTELQ
jgi:hypothetical protein